jgi:hypothetical protein
MTHTLHREGTKESLKDDYVLVITGAKGYNKTGCAPRLREMMRIVSRFNPINIGCMEVGNTGRGVPITEIIKNTKDSDLVQVVFNEKDIVVDALKTLKEADLGISVVVSGNNEDVVEIVQRAGIGDTPHTTNLSLGFMGKLEQAASDNERLITTMCGHHMISKTLVPHMVKRIRDGRITPLEAAMDMSRQCTCGAFNTIRASRILEQFAGS